MFSELVSLNLICDPYIKPFLGGLSVCLLLQVYSYQLFNNHYIFSTTTKTSNKIIGKRLVGVFNAKAGNLTIKRSERTMSSVAVHKRQKIEFDVIENKGL